MLGPGESIEGRFRIEREIGSGGMGNVYLAVDTRDHRRVAIKVLATSVLNSDVARLRLTREIDILSRLRSPYIARLYSAGALPDRSPYLVMEYLDGRDLKAELRKRGPLPVAEAVAYVVQACRGVSVAHRAAIVHRDLKPQNLFLTQLADARELKVLDFGVAKVLSEATDLSLTATDTAVGTPLYMCPEQLLDAKAISIKADVWALGVILYELLVGFTPFADDSPGAVIAAITLDDPVPVSQLRSDVPAGLSAVIEGALQKLPSARIANADELEQLLLPYSMLPDRVFVAPNSQELTRLHIRRPDRNHGNVDLRRHIKKAIDDMQARDRATVPCMPAATPVDPTPPVERLSLIPGLRRISSGELRPIASAVEGMAATEKIATGTLTERSPAASRRLLQVAVGSSLALIVAFATVVALTRYESRLGASPATTRMAAISAVTASSQSPSPGRELEPVRLPTATMQSSEAPEHTSTLVQPKSAARRATRKATELPRPPDGNSDSAATTKRSVENKERPLHL